MTPSARFDGRWTIRVGAACAVAGAGVFIGGLLLGREETMTAYLTAWTYATSLAIGALLFLMLTAMMGATWPVVVRRIAEGVVGTFPLLALLFLPVIFELRALYPWTHPWTIAERDARELVTKKLAYLNVPFFVARCAFYFVAFTVVAELVRAWSFRRDRDARFDAHGRIRTLSSAAFGPIGLVVTFASFDWVMSIAPAWYSSAFGLYFAAGSILGAWCLISLIALAAERSGALPINGSHHYAFGRTTLTFLLVWGYLGFFQLLLIWIADIPAEASWYVSRDGHWYWMSVIVILLCHLAVPVLLLLPYRAKRNGAALAAAGAWILALHFFDVYWMIHPSLEHRGFDFNGMDVAMLVGVCGLCAAFGAWRMRGRAQSAWRDPSYEDALRYHSI